MYFQPRSKLQPRMVFLVVAFIAGISQYVFGQRMPESAHGPSVAAAAHMGGNPGDYVGWQTCAGCHSAEALSFAKTVHAPVGEGLPTPPAPSGPSSSQAAGKKAAAAAQGTVAGCETCHGPGKAHAEAEENAAGDSAKELAATKLIFSFHASPKANSERCLICHVTGQKQDSFEHSQHAAAGVSCNECHSAHLVKEVKEQSRGGLNFAQAAFFQVPQLPETVRWLHSGLLKEPEPNLCFSCHGNVQAQFALPIHHRVPEGLMKCSDCHNPHGSISRASLNDTQWETCVKCHVEKRGPYVFEHAAVRAQGCVICHNPHGSTNHFMLVRREGRQLCLQCHSGFHAQAATPHSRLGFQTSGECTRCHVTIHGSNLDVNFLR